MRFSRLRKTKPQDDGYFLHITVFSGLNNPRRE
jgi:hypothetical protein